MTTILSSMCMVPFSLVLSLAVTPCLLLSFVVTLYHSLSLAVTRWHLLYHSLSFLSLVVILCHSLYHSFHSLLLVFNWCITSLSFYKILIQSIKLATTYSFKIDAHKFENINEITYSCSKTFEAVHIWWNCLGKMQAYNLHIY